MEIEIWHAVVGWLAIKAIEWAAITKNSVLTDAEKAQLSEMSMHIQEGRATAQEVVHSLQEISISQRETAMILKHVVELLRDLEHKR